MAITDTDRLAAEGAELAIADHTFHVRYTPRALKLMEDAYGSLLDVAQMLQNLMPVRVTVSADPAPTVDSFSVVLDGKLTRAPFEPGQTIILALAETRVRQVTGANLIVHPPLEVPPLPGEFVSMKGGAIVGSIYHILALGLRHERLGNELEVDEDWLLDNSDARSLVDYAMIAFDALVQALPGAAIAANPTKPSRRTEKNGSSPGGSSSGSQSHVSGSRRASSGTR